MNILFIHQNFPGQFRHLAPALAAQGHRVVALGVSRTPALPGVQHVLYELAMPQGMDHPDLSPTLKDLHSKLARAESVARRLGQLAAEGFVPDVVYAHSGWGEALYVKDVFPKARLLVYAEYFYGAEGGDTAFDPEFHRPSEVTRRNVRLKNTHLLHALHAADAALSPTRFQKSQHPGWSHAKISVIHDGIDTAVFRPDPRAEVQLAQKNLRLRPGDEVVTFVARHLEPYRGYHTFMRALPALQRARPNARVVIVGGDGVSYGASPGPGRSWKKIFLEEVSQQLDLSRIHFVGKIPHDVLTQLFQVSAAHVYLSYPFVLSWSMLEAMSIGTVVVGSATAPVQEVIRHGENGFLVDFFDPEALAGTVAEVLERRAEHAGVKEAARRTVVQGYDLRSTCLPRQIQFVLG
jgi:glycosyltransferase involved in cell wall biosynthesis